ncbi:MAG: hypothetical protein ACLR3C_06155 [Eggerthella lenta]
MQLMMGGDVAAEVNPASSPPGSASTRTYALLDEEALIAWAKQLEAACDTVGTERTTRPDGKVITVAGGRCGWLTDGEALLELVKAWRTEPSAQWTSLQNHRHRVQRRRRAGLVGALLRHRPLRAARALLMKPAR